MTRTRCASSGATKRRLARCLLSLNSSELLSATPPNWHADVFGMGVFAPSFAYAPLLLIDGSRQYCGSSELEPLGPDGVSPTEGSTSCASTTNTEHGRCVVVKLELDGAGVIYPQIGDLLVRLMCNIDHLQSIQLSNNPQLEGDIAGITQSCARMKELRALDLAGAGLSGPLPQWLVQRTLQVHPHHDTHTRRISPHTHFQSCDP